MTRSARRFTGPALARPPRIRKRWSDRPKHKKGPERTRMGPVVTEKRVYLDRGAADGLALQQTVRLRRGAAKFASCQIEILGARRRLPR